MKKILFIAPDYYGFNEVVFEGLKKYSSYEVFHINSAKYQYKNLGEKIYNFFSKTFFGKNIKPIKQEQHIQDVLLKLDYDILVVIGAYVLSKKNLEIALQKATYSIAIFWDSIEKIPMQQEYIHKFDICYSFDKEDCDKYNLTFNTNFYFVDEKNDTNTFDISYLATYDNRISNTISIFDYFEKNKIKAKAKIFTYPSHPIEEKLPNNMEEIHQKIPFAKGYEYCLDSKAILDIAHPHQRGLSFRPFEAMGLGKKLITTNKDIVNYDFYNPTNIFVIENIDDFSIPKSFFETDFERLPKEITEKYHIKNWVKNILSNTKK